MKANEIILAEDRLYLREYLNKKSMRTNKEIVESKLKQDDEFLTISQPILDAMKEAQIEIFDELEGRFPIGDNWEEYFNVLKQLREELK